MIYQEEELLTDINKNNERENTKKKFRNWIKIKDFMTMTSYIKSNYVQHTACPNNQTFFIQSQSS